MFIPSDYEPEEVAQIVVRMFAIVILSLIATRNVWVAIIMLGIYLKVIPKKPAKKYISNAGVEMLESLPEYRSYKSTSYKRNVIPGDLEEQDIIFNYLNSTDPNMEDGHHFMTRRVLNDVSRFNDRYRDLPDHEQVAEVFWKRNHYD
jgi:hypothetical protein